MSDTTVTTEAPTPAPIPLPNDAAARSPTGEILEPSQIVPPKPTTETPPPKPSDPPAATSTSKPDDKPAAGAPETYTDFKAPDGYSIAKETIDAATPIFKDLGLTQDQAQKLVDFHTQQMIAAAKGPTDAIEALQTKWRTETLADADMKAAVNGDKTGLEAVKLDIGRALNAIGDAQLVANFKDVMNTTGVGDNPAFVKALWKMSSFITEGKHVSGGGPSPHGQSAPGTSANPGAAKSLYPNLS